MTIKFLLDTNVISEPLRPRPNGNILEKIQTHQDEVGITVVVWHELLFACFRLPESERRTAIEAYIFEVIGPSIPILPYDERAAHWHAIERTRLTGTGYTPPYANGQIAAITAVRNLVLITRNISDFAHFQNIQVEDWGELTG